MADLVVSGYMARHPVAGNLLAYFHYVLGLHRLGHRVTYLEESGWSQSAYNPLTSSWTDFPEEGLRRVRALFAAHCPAVRVVFVDRQSGRMDGATHKEVRTMLADCDLLLDLGGVCWLPEFRLARRRALVDMDPMFTQVSGFASDRLGEFGTHFSYGQGIGSSSCSIPTRGIRWQPALPPVVIDLWDGLPSPPSGAAFTTIGNWTAYGGITYGGQYYGQKDQEFRRVLDVPAAVDVVLEAALSGAGPAGELGRAGWRVVSAAEVSDDVDRYRHYIGSSLGEFTVAKNAYVASSSGWFSDRSACYLAAGRPVVLQDTGFSRWLPVGQGLHAFQDTDSAVAALLRVIEDWPQQCVAARDIAMSHLSHEVVLPQLVDVALAGPVMLQTVRR